MTIEVTIQNKDKHRRIEAVEVHYSKDGGPPRDGFNHMIEPGRSLTVHIHMLMDLRVREAEAALQMRPKTLMTAREAPTLDHDEDTDGFR